MLQRAVRAVETRAVKNASRILVVSRRMRDLVCEEWGLSPDRFTVIPNGYFEETVAGYTRRSSEGNRVAFLGTLHPKLDADAFVEIARLPSVDEVAVIGDGAKRDALEEQKERLRLDALRIHGRLPDDEAFEILARSSVAINPQRRSRLQEASSPVKLFYYAALGLPMVVTRGPDAADELAEAGAAEVVDEAGPFADRVASIVENRDRRNRMASEARELAADWTWSARCEKLVEFYEPNT
jgi:glycosyltransferase involved in cell wall biosynthesis